MASVEVTAPRATRPCPRSFPLARRTPCRLWLAAIHRLLRGKHERLRPQIANLGFNCERRYFQEVIELNATMYFIESEVDLQKERQRRICRQVV
jgi:hypothetical protein